MPKFQVKYYLFFAFSLIFFCIAFLVIPLEYALNFANDDSFFYLKIAKNITKGLGITFDGLGSTSGFHPLYLILATLLFSAAKLFSVQSPETFFRIICIFHVLLIHLITLTAFLFFRKEENGGIKLTVFSLATAALVFIRDFGLESHVSCLIFVLLMFNRQGEQNIKKIIVNSALISLLFLSRTDYLWSLIPLIIFADYITSAVNRRNKALALNIIFVITVSVIYYIINFTYTGHAMPVTTAVLNSFPSSVIAGNVNELFSNPIFLFNQTPKLIFSLTVFIAAWILIRKKNKSDYIFIFCSSIGLTLNLIVHLFFNRYSIREWYLTLPLFTVIILFTLIYGFKNKTVNYAVIIMLFITAVVLLYSTRLSVSKWMSSYDYAKKLEAATSKNDYIYQYDYSGAVSFFSNRNIVDGDGFAGSYEYIGYLKSNRIPEFIVEKKIKYVSTILSDSIKCDDGGKFIFYNEPFLNPLEIKCEEVKLVAVFYFNSAAKNKKGVFVLLRTIGI